MSQYSFSELGYGRLIGEFRITEVYPEGSRSISRVVQAEPITDGDLPTALKISRPGESQEYNFAALHEEVKTLQKLNQRGVVQLRRISSGEYPYKERAIQIVGKPWFFGMEFLNGGSLEAFLRSIGPLSLGEATAICHQVGTALEYVHGRGFAHNDVRPDHILFRRELRVGDRMEPVLINFRAGPNSVRPEVFGPVAYAAPEQLQASHDLSLPDIESFLDPSKADVWSMGILLYRLVVGNEPFRASANHSTSSAILRDSPESMMNRHKDLPQQLDEFIIEGCLCKDPNDRAAMRDYIALIGQYSGDWRVQRVPIRRRKLPWRRD